MRDIGMPVVPCLVAYVLASAIASGGVATWGDPESAALWSADYPLWLNLLQVALDRLRPRPRHRSGQRLARRGMRRGPEGPRKRRDPAARSGEDGDRDPRRHHRPDLLDLRVGDGDAAGRPVLLAPVGRAPRPAVDHDVAAGAHAHRPRPRHVDRVRIADPEAQVEVAPGVAAVDVVAPLRRPPVTRLELVPGRLEAEVDPVALERLLARHQRHHPVGLRDDDVVRPRRHRLHVGGLRRQRPRRKEPRGQRQRAPPRPQPPFSSAASSSASRVSTSDRSSARSSFLSARSRPLRDVAISA